MRFKDRIAIQYLWATAVLMAICFIVVYLVAREVVFANLDRDLDYEAEKHTYEVRIQGDSIRFYNKAEWEEREHREVQVNPVFIQIIDRHGKVMDKSPNLKEGQLKAHFPPRTEHFNSELNTQRIRQVQLALKEEGELKGYILAAMSSESALSILSGLAWVLFWVYLFLLLTLFFFSRQLAQRNIKPVEDLTQAVQGIGQHQFTKRVQLPKYQDEIYQLSQQFNQLLDRIEQALNREKEFTSDASHELRTPIASLRGTLEVLIRRERTAEEYQEKIKYCLGEIDRMSDITDQLLTMARIEQLSPHQEQQRPLSELIDETLKSLEKSINELDIQIHRQKEKETLTLAQHQAQLILGNILGNAVKYNQPEGKIWINLLEKAEEYQIEIGNLGKQIPRQERDKIFQAFYRGSDCLESRIKGNGLGLAIAKKAAESLGAKLRYEARAEKENYFILTLSKN